MCLSPVFFETFFDVHTQAIFTGHDLSERANSLPGRWRLVKNRNTLEHKVVLRNFMLRTLACHLEKEFLFVVGIEMCARQDLFVLVHHQIVFYCNFRSSRYVNKSAKLIGRPIKKNEHEAFKKIKDALTAIVLRLVPLV